MKKSKNVLINLLIIVFALISSFSVFACGDAPAGSNDNQVYSTACKKAAAAIGETLTDKKQEGAKGFSFVETTDNSYNGIALTLIYYIGLLYEDTSFNITENPMRFGGKYDFNFGGNSTSTQEIYIIAYAVFDYEKDFFSLSFSQEVSTVGYSGTSELYLIVNYDFDSKIVNDMFVYMNDTTGGSMSYCAKISGGKVYSLNSDEDAERTNAVSVYNTMDKAFTELKESTVNLTKDIREKFVAAQKYADNILNQNSGISIHND